MNSLQILEKLGKTATPTVKKLDKLIGVFRDLRKLAVKKPSNLFVIITALWVYSLVFYGLEAVAFLNFRGWIIVFGLGVPLFFACSLPIEYLVRRLE